MSEVSFDPERTEMRPVSPIPIGGIDPASVERHLSSEPENTQPQSRLRIVAINLGLVASGLLVGAGIGSAFMMESHPGPRLLLTENIIPVSWSVGDCPVNWEGTEVDPIELERAFRLVDPLIEDDMAEVRWLQLSGPSTFELSDEEYARRWGVEQADRALGTKLDDVGDVACKQGGKIVATHVAEDTVHALYEADYVIDPTKGLVSLPS